MKQQPIRLLDIVPDKWYMARAYANSKDITWQPCKVVCTLEHGWERGYVALEFHLPRAKANVKFAQTKKIQSQNHGIFVSRNANKEWVFMDSARQLSLIELDISLLNRALCKINADLNDLETRKQAIRDILDEVQAQGQ